MTDRMQSWNLDWIAVAAIVLVTRAQGGATLELSSSAMALVAGCALALLFCVRRGSVRTRASRVVVLGGAVYAGALVGEWLAASLYGTQAGVGLLAHAVSLLARGELADGLTFHGRSPDGGLPIVLGWDKSLLDTATCFVAAACGYLLAARAGLSLVVRCGVGVGAVLVLHLLLATVVFQEQEGLFSPRYPSALGWFRSGLTHSLILLAFGVASARLCQAPRAASLTLPRPHWSALLVAMVVVVFAHLTCLRLPESERRLSVLIDDSHCNYWNPTARLMTPDWFGDFSTYNMALGAEYLGYRHDVRVFEQGALTTAALASVDVLVLKTPERDFEIDETDAIRAFVERGGGLLLIGDHTNLMGMSDRLNRFASWVGMSFEFDAVSSMATGGFVRVGGGPVCRHPALAMDPGMEFMTGCSLRLFGEATPLMIVPDALCQPGDYSGGSYFGRRSGDGRAAVGPVVAAAMGELGRGRVVAFTDSTVFSSFAIWNGGRAEILAGFVEIAGWGSARVTWAAWLAAALAGALGLLVVRRCAGGSQTDWWLAVAGPAVWLGAVTADARAVDAWRRQPDATRSMPIVEVACGYGRAALPQSLGSWPRRLKHVAYDTFATSIARSGLMPREVSEQALPGPASVAFVHLRPFHQRRPEARDRIRQWIRAGHCYVLVIDDVKLVERVFEEATGAAIDTSLCETSSWLDGEVTVTSLPHGQGRIVVVTGAAWFSREALGHAFSLPDKVRRTLHDIVRRMLIDFGGVQAPQRDRYRLVGE